MQIQVFVYHVLHHACHVLIINSVQHVLHSIILMAVSVLHVHLDAQYVLILAYVQHVYKGCILMLKGNVWHVLMELNLVL